MDGDPIGDKWMVVEIVELGPVCLVDVTSHPDPVSDWDVVDV